MDKADPETWCTVRKFNFISNRLSAVITFCCTNLNKYMNQSKNTFEHFKY